MTEQLKEAQEAQEKDPNILVVELKKPFNFEGREHTAVHLDFSEINGQVMESAMQEWRNEGNFSLLPTLDPAFCRVIAERAAGLPREFFHKLTPGDYVRVSAQVAGFLNN